MLLRAENASLIREIIVEGGVAAPPVLAGKELTCITGSGALALIDLGTGTTVSLLPIALGAGPFPPRYRADTVVACDRAGRIVSVSVSERRIVWTRDLGVRLGMEPEIGEGRLFAWTSDKMLRALSSADGSDVAPAIRDVASPPLLSGGSLYWGDSSGALVVAEAATGRIVKRLPIAETSVVRPIIVGGVLYAGTGGGKIIKVDLSR